MADAKGSALPGGGPLAGPEKIFGLVGGVNKSWLASQLATYITAMIVDSAPTTLDTLNELAAALGDDPNFAATTAAALAGKQPLDADLTAIAALATTSWGRALLTMASATALRAELKSPYILAQHGAASAALTGGTAALDFVTVTLPGGALGPNGSIEIETYWTCTENANTKTVSITLDGSVMQTFGLTTNGKAGALMRLANRNSASAQLISRNATTSPYGSSTVAHGTAAIDTSVDKVLTIRGQLANGADSLTLEGYIIKVFPGA
ncbi:hypothetical protein N6H05_08585 [Sphingobium sp. WTD-1]|uniref:hypothetical protein n=1 Tax=Sphingobium sp. WTD-1 TaxID=2979467 RepID=UPI0024DEB78F|nr:hypothetical protein [Sphingobium sp. WTD-1]WIA57837.1 hypothetical protein N6H05_08585 [Sphingobium sp. WTD-1]